MRWALGWILLIIKHQLSMKKHRKVGNRTDTNFFTTEFKLTPSEFPKERNSRKLNSSFNTFKHQLLRQEHKHSLRSQSKDAKPVIEHLNFLATGREDNFKAPHSLTKRSVSRGREEPKNKPELQNMQHFDESYMDILVKDAKKFSVGQIDPKKFKPISVKHYMKEKLEKSALEKFKATVLKENEENQNVVGEENTCALIQLMKTARMNNELGMVRNSRELKSKEPSVKYKSVPSDQEEENKLKQGTAKGRPESRRGSNADEEHKQYAIESREAKKPYMAPPKANESLFKKFADENSKTQALKTKQDSAKLLQPPKIKQSTTNFRSDVILPQPIQNIKTNQSESRQEFEQSEEESSYSQDLGLETKQSLPRRQSQKRSTEQLKREDTINSAKRKDSVASSNAEKPAEVKRTISNPPPKVEDSKKVTERKADIPSDRTLALGRKDSQGSEKQQQPMKPVPLSRPPSLRQAEHEMLAEIPSATTINKGGLQKPPSTKEIISQTQKQKTADYLQVQDNKVEKVLTANYFEQDKYKNVEKKPTPAVKAPPAVQPKQQHLNKAKFQRNDDYDDEQMEEITIGKGGVIQNVEKVEKEKKPAQPDPKKSEPAAAKPPPPLPQQPTPPPPLPDSQPLSAQQNEPSEFQPGPLDELIYYIERIEDIGQYRMKSKDLYSDKSIDKQLLQTHKICAYYMAHQFLYLTRQAHETLTASAFTHDYHNITAQELETLREEGELQGELENISANIEESKKLLKKSYEEGKAYLRKEEQILLMDGRTNYHLKCCAALIKEFRLVHLLHQRAPSNPKLTERCCYLIELYCILKMFSGEEVKEYEDYDEIEDPLAHIAAYRQLMLGQ